MNIIQDLSKAYPKSSIQPLIDRMVLNLLNGCLAIIDETVELQEKAGRLVDAGWRGVQQEFFDSESDYAGLPVDEVFRLCVTKILSDDYQPPNNNTELIRDALILRHFFSECSTTKPLPMALVARGFSSAGVLMKEMMRALKITREINADMVKHLKSVDKQAAKRQPVLDAYIRIPGHGSMKNSEVPSAVIERLGWDNCDKNKSKIKRYLTKEGMRHFPGYE